tara:strand:+ start:34 stop:291 length:258 start_codon:yes stop_codon:yes gene_type:complete
MESTDNNTAQQLYKKLEHDDLVLQESWQREVSKAYPIVFSDRHLVTWKTNVSQYTPDYFTLWQRVKLWWLRRHASMSEFNKYNNP